MNGNPVCWFEIFVQDMARAKAFYEAVFHVKLEEISCPAMEMWGFPVEKGGRGAGGTLVKKEGVRAGGNSTLVYFCCDDCAVEQGRVEKAGGHVAKAKLSIGGYGYISLVLDTEGNMIGLHSQK